MPNSAPLRPAGHTSIERPPLVPKSADDFESLVADALRQTRRSAHIGRVESRILDDVARGRGVRMLRQALEIARWHCTNPADATALPEAFRGFVLAGHAAEHTVYDAFRGETDANGICDLAQLEYAIAPSKATRQRAIEALNRQLVETRKALDALHRDDANGRLSLYQS